MSTKNNHKDVVVKLKALADPEIAKSSKWFFKTNKGQYGEGDKFLGIRVPEQRKIAASFSHISIEEITLLLRNPYHEARLTAVFLLVNKYKKADEKTKKDIFDSYLANSKYLNNWDIVDSSAHKIVGPYLSDKPNKMVVLEKLARSDSLWERRIAMISTAYNIAKLKSADEALELAKILLKDKHDLMHKAVGWMLREIGKYIDEKILTDFLDIYAVHMPRTMLRYSIERLEESKRKHYLSIKAG